MSTGTAKALELRGLRKAYRLPGGRSVPAVRDFSLRVEPGEFVTLLGPSGSGKTTVLRTLAGLEEPDAGEILLDGVPLTPLPPHQRHIGLVFQNYALFPHLTVFENVAYSLRIRRTPDVRIRDEVEAALKTLGLEELASRLPGQLSGGQQQRVALARALVMHPDLLLFDEPLSNLDAKLRFQVRSELRRLQKRLGITALYVTHDQAEAMSLSDRIAVMRDGRVEQVGTPEDIYARPATLFVADFIGRVNILPGRVVDRLDRSVVVEALERQWNVAADRCPAAAGDVLVLLRPEAVGLVEAGQGDLAGTVEELEYRGDQTEYRIQIGGVHVVVVESSPRRTRRIVEGDRVGLRVFEDTLHILPAQREG